MPFKKLDAQTRPPRQWALVGYPGSGKSTFAARRCAGRCSSSTATTASPRWPAWPPPTIYELSENPVDHVDPRRIAELLRQNMGGRRCAHRGDRQPDGHHRPDYDAGRRS